MKHFLISAAMAGIAAAAVVLASAARAETPDDQSLKAATRVLQFAAYTKGILYEAVVDGDSVVERKPADPAIDLVDFVRIKDEPCTYERRDFARWRVSELPREGFDLRI